MTQVYKTPGAFRQALEARLRNQANIEGLDIPWLRRQIAYERLLARIFHRPDTIWLLKGGYAIELRLQHRARTTLDIDLMIADIETLRLAASADPGEQAADIAFDQLQKLASLDLGDFFYYLLSKPTPIFAAPKGGIRCPVDCRVAGRTFVNFRIDVGFGDCVVGEPEWIPGRNLLEFAGIASPHIPLLPVEQQIAEKVHAYTSHREDRINTRDKDLVDLVLLFEVETLDSDTLQEAVKATFSNRRSHPLPRQLPPPPEEWRESFEKMAGDLNLPVKTLDEAYIYIRKKWDNLALGRGTL